MIKSTKIQSILFDRDKWTATTAKKWLLEHGKKTPVADTTDRFYRFRQTPPFAFQAGSFRTIVISRPDGIKAVIGRPRTRLNPKKSKLRKSKTVSRIGKPTTKKNAAVKRPWLPSTLVDLATAISIDLEGGIEIKFPLRGSFALCSTRSGQELWIVSRRKAKKVDTTDIDDKAEKLYESFTGFEHSSVGALVHAPAKQFTRVGRAINIVYRSDKFSTAGKTSDYVHAFRNYPTVSVDDPKRPKIVALRGGHIRVKKEGITG